MSLRSTEHLTSTFPVGERTKGNNMFFLAKRARDRVCASVPMSVWNTDKKSCIRQSLSACLQLLSKRTQGDEVSGQLWGKQNETDYPVRFHFTSPIHRTAFIYHGNPYSSQLNNLPQSKEVWNSLFLFTLSAFCSPLLITHKLYVV